jgi:hypothetical protein
VDKESVEKLFSFGSSRFGGQHSLVSGSVSVKGKEVSIGYFGEELYTVDARYVVKYRVGDKRLVIVKKVAPEPFGIDCLESVREYHGPLYCLSRTCRFLDGHIRWLKALRLVESANRSLS